MTKEEAEFLANIDAKKDAIEKFARNEVSVGIIRDEVSGLTVEDKLLLQLDHMKL